MNAYYNHVSIALALLCELVMSGCGGILLFPSTRVWIRHTIDDASRGADGTRLADVNGDGWPDIATAWEEGGLIRVAIHPGRQAIRRPWPAVTVGTVGSPEDAAFVDLNADGAIDVVSSSEGGTRTIWIHWAPPDPGSYLNPAAWRTEAIDVTKDSAQWMFTLPVDVNEDGHIDLIAGSKNEEARIGWLENPGPTRLTAQWQWFPIRSAGWTMSLAAADLDHDGDLDVLVSDRRGPGRGVFWLENPGPGPLQFVPWVEHRIGGGDQEVMFLTLSDLNGDGLEDVVAATAGKKLIYFQRTSRNPDSWQRHDIAIPAQAGTGKAVAVGDIDQDGRLDLVFSCENARDRLGVMWLSYRRAPTDPLWEARDISGTDGRKFDLLELVDLDADGDLDVVTSEEGENLGVIWYENATLP